MASQGHFWVQEAAKPPLELKTRRPVKGVKLMYMKGLRPKHFHD